MIAEMVPAGYADLAPLLGWRPAPADASWNGERAVAAAVLDMTYAEFRAYLLADGTVVLVMKTDGEEIVCETTRIDGSMS